MSLTPTIDAIRREIITMSGDNTPALWLRVTHDVWNTIRVERHRVVNRLTDEGHEPSPETLLGLKVHRYPVGSIDDPCWQLMSTEYRSQ